ncbi:PilC/PilY family type IV pilus protein [Acinetobacter sp. VNK23]|uniref:pilus assembly protein n=1 Tax=Acinetobacter thutiue TaxID=2998078 RepID=UPI002575A737|nr:PilC/PilY family type IV pilus protein [Acinetobacter thutiue]MDM1018999.1 PilC/PilY family type IV pilus protein [Acinetobacter thutiue]
MKNNKMKQQKQTKNQKIMNNKPVVKWLFIVGSALSCSLMLSPVIHASDVEIYRQGTSGGDSTIMLMVDASQSMGSPALDLLKDYPLCISSKIFAVVGALPVVDVKLTPAAGTEAYCDVVFPKSVLDLLGTVDTLTGTQKNSLLGLQSSLDYMRSSCTPFSKLESGEPARSNKILAVNLNLGEGYRCYSRLSRIKIAVRDVLNGNATNGIIALPAKTTVGLSVFSAKNGTGVNQKAGMILVPAKPLDDVQRAALKAAIDGLVPSADPLGNTLDKVVGILGNVLDKVDILGLVTDVLGLIGSLPSTLTALLANPETPTATAYAETGAYLLGYNTRGTGERLSEFEVPVRKSDVAYKCLSRQTDNDCASYENNNRGNPKEYPVPTGYIRSEQVRPSNGLLSDLLGSILGFLSGSTSKDVIRYYYTADASYSGYGYRASSVPMKSNGDDYDNPQSIKDKISRKTTSECQAQGIFVLTGSVPKLTPADGVGIQRVMQKSLGKTATTNINDFCTVTPPTGWKIGSSTATWACIGNYSKALLNTNAAYSTQVEIKTGVAGIGKEFNYVRLDGDNVVGAGTGGSIVNSLLSSVKSLVNSALSVLSLVADLRPILNLVDLILPTQPTTTAEIGDVENLVHWGKDGKGGWYTEASTGGIAQSITNFSKHIVDAESAPFLGLQTIPADPLTPYQLSNDVYNSIFAPTDHQSWFGNLKKYSVTDTTSGENVIRLVDWKDQWNGAALEDKEKGSTLFDGGVLKQLKTLRPSKTDDSTRTLWINRNCQSGGAFTESQNLKKVTLDYLNDSSEARCKDDATAKDSYGGYLINLLGYQLDNPESATGNSLAQSEPLWQVGMPLHSTPLKLTQFAKFNGGNIDRNDYIVFGSTQGLLHVVNASDGKEKFAFLPNEMLENTKQRESFTKNRKGRWQDMPYGIDGAWTAYTEYAYGMDDSGKVYATVGTAKSKQGTVIATGKQFVYGGLRMGGRSYYALDLADLDNPKLKFHINPEQAAANTPLSYMGQSWSRPTITYVNWKGQRKQVMFVGGGYDANGATVACNNSGDNMSKNLGYECKDYEQTNKKGAGVYMFDADNGNLLWWASANATDKNNTATENALNVGDMKYSVVSRINVADRDGNGLVDHLYFGDLGGQVWRIDLNANTATGNFAKRAIRILNLHQANGRSPRFYDAPSFSVYGYEKPLAVVSIASGNRSLPASDPSSGAIYNLFDRDVTRNNLYALNTSDLETQDIDLTTSGKSLRGMLSVAETKDKNIEDVKALIPNGWVVSFDPDASVGKDGTAGKGKKVMDEMAVINKNLYASVYDPGTTPTCPVQVRGKTEVYRYCLPFGLCEQKQLSETMGLVGKSGDGIVALSVGAGSSTTGALQSRGVVSNTAANPLTGTPYNQMRRQIVPLTWYENNE